MVLHLVTAVVRSDRKAGEEKKQSRVSGLPCLDETFTKTKVRTKEHGHDTRTGLAFEKDTKVGAQESGLFVVLSTLTLPLAIKHQLFLVKKAQALHFPGRCVPAVIQELTSKLNEEEVRLSHCLPAAITVAAS